MSTFLELTQQLVAELGIGGANQGATVPSAVASQTGQLWNAVNWIKQAHNNICLLHPDWNFLSVEYQESLVVGNNTIPAHSGSETVKKWDRSSFFLNRSTDGYQLDWIDWQTFKSEILPGMSNKSNARPTSFTIKPDNTILLDNKADDTYTLDAEFWKVPTVLTADADTPDYPTEYHRLTVCEAAIKYGNKEAALEIIQGMEAEYIMLLETMRSDQLPMREWDRIGAEDYPLTVAIPGYE